MLYPNVETFIGCDSSYRAASIVLYGAPYDSTTSYRPGARFGPAAIRHESYGLETYSPYQNADLTDFDIFDSGDLELCFGSSESALADIQSRAAEILHDGKFPLLLGGEHLVTLGAVRAMVEKYPDLHIVHFDANGREIARINTFDTGEGASTYKVNGKLITLPAEFKKRRANRGMEGLTVTPDQKYLVGIMQSALYNPDKTTKKSTMTRLVRIELATGNIEQFIYQQQSTDSDSNSGIVAIDKDTFYVIERDGELPQLNAAAIKKVYKISLAGATNLEAVTNTTDIVQDVNLGLMVGGKTLEQLTLTADGWNVLASKGIRPVSKTEYLDAVMKLNYPHDKLEGLLLFPNGTLGLINDDDFGIAAQVKDSKDFITPKYIDKTNSDIDSDRLYIYRP